MALKPLLTHVAGVDVHQEILNISILIGEASQEPTLENFQCKTFSQDLIQAGHILLSKGVKHVVMESTGIYWKPVFNVWQPMGFQITLVNAYHVKKVPGRKTDALDSEWLAELHRFGLVKASFIPSAEFQQIRLLNRHRENLVDDLSRVKNRIQKVLEDGNVKLGVVVSDVFGVAGLAALQALSEGIRDTQTLLSRIPTLKKIARKEDMQKALSHSLSSLHLFLLKQLLKQFQDLNSQIDEIDKEIDRCFQPYIQIINDLDEIPGIDKILAQTILAEASNDLSSFNDDRNFAAWAGVAPGNNESAGKKKELKPEKGILSFEKLSS